MTTASLSWQAWYNAIMRMWKDLQESLYYVGLAVIRFLVYLLISAALVGSGIALEFLVGLSIEDSSAAYEVLEFALDVSLIGSAVVVAICGAVVVAGEAIRSTYTFLRQLSGKD